MQFGEEWNLKSHVLKQLEEFTCLMYGLNRESSMDGLRAKPLRKIVGEDEKLTSKSKVDLARLHPCHSVLKPHLQRVNHRLALYNRDEESILKNQIPTMMVKRGYGLRIECWNRCGPSVLRYQTHWLIYWTMGIVTMKKRRRKNSRKDEFDFDYFS